MRLSQHRSPVRAALVAVAATLVLVGCGGGDDSGDDTKADDETTSSESTSSDVEAAAGDTIEADGFTYSVPDGWKQNTEMQGAAITLAADMTDKDGFADNVNVVVDNTINDVEGDDLADALVKSLENANVKEVSVREPFVIDGEEAVHTTGLFSLNGNEYRVDQYTLAVDGTGYVITFSHNKEQSEADRDKVDHSILSSWTWG